MCLLGEADPKHLFILEVRRDAVGDIKHRLTKKKLDGVRPFQFKTISLVEQNGAYNASEASVKETVRWTLETMVSEGHRQNPEMLPLIRLRIDYTGYDLIRCQEIQKRFAGKVANPDDMLLWFKKPKRKE